MSRSKPLGNLGFPDYSRLSFAKEMLCNDVISGVNFDSIHKHPKKGYIIFEFLLCEESQPRATPYSSHPNRYWYKNKQKFISLWGITENLKGTLYLVNYAKKGTKYENEVSIIHVKSMDGSGITSQKIYKTNRIEFSEWYRKLNKECLQ